MSDMELSIYKVHAYRWGNRELHSYILGVYSKKHFALKAAESEEEWRAGKYQCEVLEWVPDSKSDDESPGMSYKIIKPLSPKNMPVVVRWFGDYWIICHSKSYQNAFHGGVNRFNTRGEAVKFAEDHGCVVEKHSYDKLQNYL